MDYFYYKLDKKKRQEWKNLANEMECKYFEEKQKRDYCDNFKTFQRGLNWECWNLIEGQNQGCNIAVMECFDESWTDEILPNFTACLLTKENLSLPSCYLRDKAFNFTFLKREVIMKKIKFENDTLFSNRFIVMTEDNNTQEMFSDSVRAEFIKHKEKKVVFESRGNQILLSQDGDVNIEKVRSIAKSAYHILNILQEYSPVQI
ncbi:hypothetical protein [Candidatus Uabimicrobium sp. HlEnr_7]|uniref:hypothetical protein n=1 Tax=Candidatus Uabimicrobium helgolandensis TaxID=3095367 RepID=UPI0035592E34